MEFIYKMINYKKMDEFRRKEENFFIYYIIRIMQREISVSSQAPHLGAGSGDETSVETGMGEKSVETGMGATQESTSFAAHEDTTGLDYGARGRNRLAAEAAIGRKRFRRNRRQLTNIQTTQNKIIYDFIIKLKPYNITRLAMAYVKGGNRPYERVLSQVKESIPEKGQKRKEFEGIKEDWRKENVESMLSALDNYSNMVIL